MSSVDPTWNAVRLTSTHDLEDVSDLEALDHHVGAAEVIGVGVSERFARELVGLRTRLAVWLVVRHGARVVSLEDDADVVRGIDAGLDGDEAPTEQLVGRLWRGWHTPETVGLLRWLRRRNRERPGGRISLRGHDARSTAGPRPGPDDVDLAERILSTRERDDGPVVVLGGLVHTVAARAATVSFPPRRPTQVLTAGGQLRHRLGPRYRSIGLLFDHGTGLSEYPSAPDDFAEAALAGHGAEALAVAPAHLRAGTGLRWATDPAITRLVGPRHDPERDREFHLAGGTTAEWFDLVVHRDAISPVTFLDDAAG